MDDSWISIESSTSIRVFLKSRELMSVRSDLIQIPGLAAPMVAAALGHFTGLREACPFQRMLARSMSFTAPIGSGASSGPRLSRRNLDPLGDIGNPNESYRTRRSNWPTGVQALAAFPSEA